jgi:uncharacterized protein YprB with RNaseH-like and TPR domain
MTQKEINDRLTFRCKHRHNGFSHQQCFKREEEKIGFLDIEASNLNASFGCVYTYCIKELDGPLIKRAISLDDLHNGNFDKNLLKKFIEDCLKFDRLVLHYGTDFKFDLPFLRTRAVFWGLDFPEHKFLYASDTHTILKKKFKFHSNRLEAVCDFFNIPAKGHKLNSKIWLDMITGNRKRMRAAIDYILTHNVEDVLSLEALWKKINAYVPLAKTSI